MSLFPFIYNELLFRPLFNLLVGITNVLPAHNVGLSILIVTFIVRLILLPPSIRQAKNLHQNQAKISGLKKELDAINKKYKNDQAKKAQATMELYKKTGINPASGCLPLLIQLPILIALYRVFLTGMGPETFSFLYPFVSQPGTVQLSFLGVDLTQTSLRLAILAGLFQFFLMRLFTPAPTTSPSASKEQSMQMMASMQKNMMYIFPVMTVFIALQLPAALALYWIATTIFGIAQQYFFKKRLNITTPTAV